MVTARSSPASRTATSANTTSTGNARPPTTGGPGSGRGPSCVSRTSPSTASGSAPAAVSVWYWPMTEGDEAVVDYDDPMTQMLTERYLRLPLRTQWMIMFEHIYRRFVFGAYSADTWLIKRLIG